MILLALFGWVFAFRHTCKLDQCLLARGLRRPDAVRTNGVATGPHRHAVLQNVAALTASSPVGVWLRTNSTESHFWNAMVA